MKLYEFILTIENSTEVYKDYRFFKSLKECKKYIESFGMDIVRVRKVSDNEYISSPIIESAQKELEVRSHIE